MLDYNTQNRQLALPEYGRNIQQMVDFCVTIPDREERTRCAYTIIDVMRNLMTDNNNQDENLINSHRLFEYIGENFLALIVCCASL